MAAENVLRLGVLAGNASNFARRATQPLLVELPGQRQWQDLPRALGLAGFEYAISGLVATRPDRIASPASVPVVYVNGPKTAMEQLGLGTTPPLRGTMLAAAGAGEMDGAEDDGGLVFVSRAQAMLDGIACGGRQSGKAEAVALAWKLEETERSARR